MVNYANNRIAPIYESRGTLSSVTHLEAVYAMGMLFSAPIRNALCFARTGYRQET